MTRDPRPVLMLLVVVLLAILLTGCSFEPDNPTPLEERPWFRAQWDTAQACTGHHARYEDLRFYSVPEIDGGKKAGRTIGKDIYIAEGYEKYPLVIKHEMIHALGIHGHPYHPFVDPCKATWESWK